MEKGKQKLDEYDSITNAEFSCQKLVYLFWVNLNFKVND